MCMAAHMQHGSHAGMQGKPKGAPASAACPLYRASGPIIAICLRDSASWGRWQQVSFIAGVLQDPSGLCIL